MYAQERVPEVGNRVDIGLDRLVFLCVFQVDPLKRNDGVILRKSEFLCNLVGVQPGSIQ